MARRPVQPERPNLTVDQKRRCVARLQRCIADLEAFDPTKVQKRYGVPEVLALEAAIDEALSAAFGHGTPAHERYSRAAILDHGPHVVRPGPDFGGSANYDTLDAQKARQYFAEGRAQSIVLLRQAIRALEDEIADEEHLQPKAPTTPASRPLHRNKVFVVHGHDEAALQAVSRFLEKVGLEAIVLREQPDRGRTIIEKFEDCANEVGFAVILLTADDLAGPAGGPALGSQARQNVMFELGYFAGKLGRGRSCLIRKGDVDVPSDLYGIIYTDMDDADGWKLKLVRELKAAELQFDANRMWS